MSEEYGKEGPIRGIFLAEFHHTAGPKIMHQYPAGCISKEVRRGGSGEYSHTLILKNTHIEKRTHIEEHSHTLKFFTFYLHTHTHKI